MSEERKDFVGTMMRHFGVHSFPIDAFHFRYDDTLFPIVRVDAEGVHYGRVPWCMSCTEKGFAIKNIRVKRSLLGSGCIIDIDNRSSQRREGW